MDAKQLEELQTTVNEASRIKTVINKMDDVIAYCKNEVGVMNISIDHRNYNQLDLVNVLTPQEVHNKFKAGIAKVAQEIKKEYEEAFKKL